MAKQKPKEPAVNVDTHSHKTSVQARVAAGVKVGNTAPKSSIYQSTPVIKQTADDVTTAGVALNQSDETVIQAEAALNAARSARAARIVTFDRKYDVYATTIEANVTTVEDVNALGATLAARTIHALEMPVRVDATYDYKRTLLKVHVHPAPGLNRVVVEISTDPVGATTWKRLEGYGLLRALAGYGPGTYWVHAASVRKDQRSEFTAPVNVVVK